MHIFTKSAVIAATAFFGLVAFENTANAQHYFPGMPPQAAWQAQQQAMWAQQQRAQAEYARQQQAMWEAQQRAQAEAYARQQAQAQGGYYPAPQNRNPVACYGKHGRNWMDTAGCILKNEDYQNKVLELLFD